MAEVWCAVHSKETLEVALKVLGGSRKHLELSTRAIGREIRSVARLEHPAIVRILDAGTVSSEAAAASSGRLTAESPFFAMELAEGGTLKEALPLADWTALRSVLTAILEALAHSHARGVIHRDLKPANILVFPDAPAPSRTRLTDFGIAGHLSSANSSASPQSSILEFCTAAYAPPEQLVGKKHLLGPASDLYSVGCLAFELGVGTPPHAGVNLIEIISRQLSGWRPSYRFLFPVPEGFQEWIATNLSASLAHRFRHAADALEALRDLGPPTTGGSPEALHRGAVQGDLLSAPTSQFQKVSAQSAVTEVVQVDRLETVQLLNPWLPAHGLAARSAPPVPEDWRSDVTWTERPQLVGAGLTLFPIRQLPFVGRTSERDLLWAALRKVASTGCAATVVVRGAAGSGKTSLSQWLAERVDQLGCAWPLRVTNTRFGSLKDGIGAALWRSQGLGLTLGEERAEALDQFRAGLELRATSEALVQSLSPSQAQSPESRQKGHAVAAAETVTEICSLLSKRRPMVLLLDDAHWAWDSLKTIESLLSRATEEDAPILVVLCVRNDLLRDRPVEAAALERVLANPHTTSIHLEELREDECRDLVAELLPFTDDVIDYVTSRSNGVPAHAVQMVADWIEQGHVERIDQGFTIPSKWRSDLPRTIHSDLQERIERLLAPFSQDARLALELLVVLAPEIDEPTLLSLAGRTGIEVDAEFLTRLEESGLASCDENRWSLRWTMVAESVEKESRRAGRWKHHQLVAGEFFAARVEAGDRAALSAAARHYVGAEKWELGIPLLLKAAQHERFLRLPNRGLELLDVCDTAIQRAGHAAPRSARAESLGLRSNLLRLAGKPAADWIALAEESEALAREGNHPKALAEALRVRGIWLRQQRRYTEGLETIEDYLSIFRTHRDAEARIEATIQKTKMLRAAGRSSEALDWARGAVAIADQHGQTADQVNTRVALLEVCFSQGDMAEALRLAEDLHPSVRDPSVPMETRFQILGWAGTIQFLVGNYERGRQAFRDASEAARTTLSSNTWFWVLSRFAEAEKSAGFVGNAKQLFEQAEIASSTLGDSEQIRIAGVNHAILEVQLGDYRAAKRRFQAIKFPTGHERDPIFDIAEEFISFFAAQAEGSWDRAEEHLTGARTRVRESRFIERDFAVLFEQAGELCLQTNRFELAGTALDEAITFWERTGGTPEDLRRCREMKSMRREQSNR